MERERELAHRKAEEERKRKDRERQQHEKVRQQELAKLAKEEERQRQFKEAERERRLRKRRRLLAKQAQRAAAAEALEEANDAEHEAQWWEIGNHVEVFSEDDWWQAVILKTRTGRSQGEMEIYVAYIGGTEDDNEWLSTNSVRVRPPTDSFWDKDGDGDDLDDEINPHYFSSGANQERKRGGVINGSASNGAASISEHKLKEGLTVSEKTSGSDSAQAASGDVGTGGSRANCNPTSTLHPQQLPLLHQQMHHAQPLMPVHNLQFPGQHVQMQMVFHIYCMLSVLYTHIALRGRQTRHTHQLN